MAITLTTFTGGQNIYVYDGGSDVYYPGQEIDDGAVQTSATEIQINWSGTTNNVTVKYSKDSGSNWTNIATGISGAGGTYPWTPDDAEVADILGTATDIATFRIRVTDETTAANSSSASDLTFNLVGLGDIHPNGSDNSLPISIDGVTNINWSEIIDYDIINVRIEYSTTAGASWDDIVASTPNDYSYVCKLSAYSIVAGDTVLLRISSADTGHEMNCFTTTVAFNIADDDDEAIPSSIREKYEDFPDRFEAHGRVSGEKAMFVDEAIMLSQLEAGEGIEIWQRDHDGIYDGDLVGAKKKALNVIIKAKGTENIDTGRPRELQGDLDFITNGLYSSPAPYGGDYYGIRLYIEIAHNWHLGNAGTDVNYVAGKTKNSFVCQVTQINSGTRSADANDVWCDFEAYTEDKIRFYCTIKGTAGWTVTPDSQVTLTKDQLGELLGTYYFEYRVKEVVPT